MKAVSIHEFGGPETLKYEDVSSAATLGKTESYNDVANWAYSELPKMFRPDTSARSFVVTV
jgi:hypothetical protein